MSLEKEINDVLTGIVRRADDELLALAEAELLGRWYFTYDPGLSVAWNLYQFSSALEAHKRSCRRWEEHHNGSMCVVERVRDKYLMPKIRAFEDELRKAMTASQ